MLFLLKDENIYRTTVASDADGAAAGTGLQADST